MEGVSKQPCIFLLGCPDAISLRFSNVLHVPRLDDEESFLNGCLSIDVSEYTLNARMLSFWQWNNVTVGNDIKMGKTEKRLFVLGIC